MQDARLVNAGLENVGLENRVKIDELRLSKCSDNGLK